MDAKEILKRKYIWTHIEQSVKVSALCGKEYIKDSNRCEDCLGECPEYEHCIKLLLRAGDIKEVKGMKFIDAIQKYKKITNDDGKTAYSTNKEGTFTKYQKGASGGFSVSIDLLMSEGWEEYKDNTLILPERPDYEDVGYHYIDDADNVVVDDIDMGNSIDEGRYDTFNYFLDKELAEYVANRQLLFRVAIVLDELNREKFNRDDRKRLIEEYINTNYSNILQEIKEYETEIKGKLYI